MANEELLSVLRKGVDVWNRLRIENPELRPDFRRAHMHFADLHNIDLCMADLREADLSRADLHDSDLRGADLRGADLREADLFGANLSGADLRKADLFGANMSFADLSRADLRGAILDEARLRAKDFSKADLSDAILIEADLHDVKLRKADLSRAVLTDADLSGADLSGANLAEARLRGANLSGSYLNGASLVLADLTDTRLDGSHVYGTSIWSVNEKGSSQRNLIITQPNEGSVTVDNLKLAQFMYMLLKNENIRQVIDTIASKVVLILGRFTEERKQILDALREEIRKRDLTPILFDFEKPSSRDLTETIFTLASMARFVIADITAAKSIPQELSHIIPNLPSVPIQPMLLASDREYAMFEHWKRFPWVLPDFLYEDEAHLLESLSDKVIAPAERKRKEQTEA